LSKTSTSSVILSLKELIGYVPQDKKTFTKLMRLHQGWWRTFVIMEKPGQHPSKPSETVCNTITNGEKTRKNFLTPNSYKTYAETIQNNLDKSQMIEEKRAVNNLLSSQPLCFNAFGEMACDLHLATEFLKLIFSDTKDVTKVLFEYRPKGYEIDHSAFDVAFKFETNDGKRNLWGFEVKYTDGFSPVAKDREEYVDTFAKNKEHFLGEYDSYRTIEFNELFRNELIGRWCVSNNFVDKVYTGMFCHHDDVAILSAAKSFQKTIRNGSDNFRIINYKDFLSSLQKLELSWQQREWSMLFWARYCGIELSKGIQSERKD
jgi:hypothetical protein